MNSKVIVALLAAGLTVPMFAQKPAEAASSTFEVNQFTGAALKAQVTLDDNNGSGKINVTVRIVTDAQNPNTGDIRGFFFNTSNKSILGGLSAAGANVNATSFAGNVSSVGNANLNGGGGQASFDGGVEIGENGLRGGRDDFQTTTFTLSHRSIPLTLSMFSAQNFGLRVTSVGTPGSSRSLSSKLDGAFGSAETSSGGSGSSSGSTQVDGGSSSTTPVSNSGSTSGSGVVNIGGAEPTAPSNPSQPSGGTGSNPADEGGAVAEQPSAPEDNVGGGAPANEGGAVAEQPGAPADEGDVVVEQPGAPDDNAGGGAPANEGGAVAEQPGAPEENVGGGTPADGGGVVNEPVNEEQPTEVADGSGSGNVPEGGMGGGDVEEVPEPMTIAGSALGLAGLMKLRRRRANKAN